MASEIRQISYLGPNGVLITVIIIVGFTAYLEKSFAAPAKHVRGNGGNGYG